MSRLLEVIVTSLQEALEAEAGGADRLELVRALDRGGLTPEANLVAQVMAAISIPVRVMLRANASLAAGSESELLELRQCAVAFEQLSVDGFVLGFAENGMLDTAAMRAVLERTPHTRVTCHRAFEEVVEPLVAIEKLKQLGQVDRILTSGGEGSWSERVRRLTEWQDAAGPEIKLLCGIGLRTDALDHLTQAPAISEVHVGRAARIPHTNDGIVSRERIRALKSALR